MKLTRLQSKSGMSLVEVLVVMVVLLIGIMSVVRLFPGGFSSLKASGERTVADRLAQADIDYWKNRPTALPGAILPINPPDLRATNFLAYTINDEVHPDDMETLQVPWADWKDSLYAPHRPYFSDVNKFRYILGETTKIPLPSERDADLTKFRARYNLAYSPIDLKGQDPYGPNADPTDINAAPQFDAIVVYSNPWMRVDGTPGREGQYGMTWDDAQKGALRLRPTPYPRRFKIDYSFWQSGQLVSVVGETINVPGDPNFQDNDSTEVLIPLKGTPVNTMSGFSGVELGSESVARRFRLLQNDEPFSPMANPPQDMWWKRFPNPYEYKILNPTLGILAFNPIGATYKERFGWYTQDLVARIDYTVLDWHFIREEKRIPDSLDAHMALPRLMSVGDFTVDQFIYGGVPTGLKDQDGLPYRPDILIVDATTGELVVNDVSGTGKNPDTDVQIDFKNGVITMPRVALTTVDPIQWTVNVYTDRYWVGRMYRFYYKVDGEWAVAPSKANVFYTQATGKPTYKQFLLSDLFDDPLTSQVETGVPLWFAICDAGKSVSVDYTFERDGKMQRVYGEIHSIANTPQQIPNNANRGCQIYLDQIDTARGERLVSIDKVKGTSFKIRTVWRDSNRWHKADIDTYLTREIQ
ncbi:MAG: prepilin-type N-terminal cleavage/methylation domain-containing protein [Armatimonadetes bacterium]|nr:prepilin-type N-terminal cleavage/methylation domain-containing protein [Armatimonadota bacterium]